MKKNQEKQESLKPSKFEWAVPPELGIPPDSLRLRLDFFHQAVSLTYFGEDDNVETKMVSAMDIAHSLASELSYNTGLLPDNTLWWSNTRHGSIYAIYVEPKIWRLALQEDLKKPPRRFTIPMPGFIFLCLAGQPPWVYAVKEKPTKETDKVYHAPLLNLFRNGNSCPGNQKYPERVNDIVKMFFISFFSNTADIQHRSKKHPGSILEMWEELKGKNKYLLDDLMPHGTISDLMRLGAE